MVEPRDPLGWRRTVGRRLAVVAALFGLCALAILARLVNLQIYQRHDLEMRAESQRSRLLEVPARRGDLLDRHGHVLAYSVDVDTVYANPGKVQNPVPAASRICGALGDCDEADRAALVRTLGRKSAFAFVRHRVDPDAARRVAELKIDGIYFMKEPGRFYPNRELAASVLGYVGAENKGLAGLEATYDAKLRGTPGQMLLELDGRKRPQAFSRVGQDPVPGTSLELTIDAFLQHLAERELEAGVLENHAAGGAVVMMDPASGEILALASYPTFNPNSYRLSTPDEQRNRGVQDVYEPGSTFKLVTASAALEEKVMRPTDLIDTGGGSIAVGPKRVVREAEGHAYGTLSLTDVIVKSSNVGAIKNRFPPRRRAARPLRQELRVRDEAVPGFSGRECRDRLAAVAVDRQRVGVGVDGLPGERDAAPDGRRGERRGQRRRARAAADRPRRDRRRRARARAPQGDSPGHVPGDRGGNDGDHGRRRHAGHRQARGAPGLHGGGKDRHGEQEPERALPRARLQRVVCRLRSLAPAGAHDPRRHRHAAGTQPAVRRHRVGADLPPHRRARAALPRRHAERDPAPPVLVARHDAASEIKVAGRSRRWPSCQR